MTGYTIIYDVYTSYVFTHTEWCCHCCGCCGCSACCYTGAVAACCCCLVLLVLLFVIVCRMAKFVAGSFNLIQSSAFFLFIHSMFFGVPLGNTVAFTYPLAALSHLRTSICLHYMLGNYGHARGH